MAASLHVPVGKIQALEDDRLETMPDIMFARALAMSVCRYLKVDATPVLARMPQQDASRLAARDERGIDSPLSRPSLMPDGGVQVLQRLLNVRAAAVAVVVLGLLYLGVQSSHSPAPAAAPAVMEVPTPTAPALAGPAEPSAAPTDASASPAAGTPVSGAATPGHAPTPSALAPMGSSVAPQTVTTPVSAAGTAK